MNMKLDNRFHKLEVAMRQVQADIKDIKKMAGKETQDRIEALEEFATYADNLLTQLNHALPDTPEPKLKQLDQSVFDGLDEKWRFAAVNEAGEAFRFAKEPKLSDSFMGAWVVRGLFHLEGAGTGYDTTNWQNSLIERDKVELTGSDLTEQIMKNQKYQAAFVSDESDKDALNSQRTALIDNVYMSDRDYRFRAELNGYRYAIPINNQGEPLTQSDVDL